VSPRDLSGRLSFPDKFLDFALDSLYFADVGGSPRRKFPPSFCTRRLFFRNRMATKHSSHTKIAKKIIQQIERHGHFVKVYRVNRAVELHVVSLDDGALHIARCNDGVGPSQECRAALVMAEALGIDV